MLAVTCENVEHCLRRDVAGPGGVRAAKAKRALLGSKDLSRYRRWAAVADAWRFAVSTHRSVDEAARAVEAALAQRSFSVLWALDVNAKLREKGLDVDGSYRILEVCSAPRAKQALETNADVSCFLPCKVVVTEVGGRTEIALPRPTALIGMLADARLHPLAEEVEAVMVAAVREAAG